MQKLINSRKGSQVFRLILLLILVVALVVGIAAVLVKHLLPGDPVYWYEDSEDVDSYFYYDVSAMSDYYAYLDDDVWAFGFEIEDGSLSGIVAIRMTNAQYAEFSDMVDWTYSDEDTPLDPVRVTGWYKDWDNQDLKDYMLEGLQTFFGDDTLTEFDLMDYLGGGYLDIRGGGGKLDGTTIAILIVLGLFLLSFVILLVGVIKEIGARKKLTANTLRKLEANGETTLLEETQDSMASSYIKPCKTYLTRDAIICCQKGLDVAMINEVTEIYGYDKTKGSIGMGLLFGVFAASRTTHSLVIVTRDNVAHDMAAVPMNVSLHNQIVQHILAGNPDVRLGRQEIDGRTLDTSVAFNVGAMPSFYGTTTPWKGRTQDPEKVMVQ